MTRIIWAGLALLAGCQAEQASVEVDVPGDGQETAAYAGIADSDLLRFTGTEPFWGGTLSGTSLVWTTPENPAGETIAVSRFSGNGGLGLNGTLAGQSFDMAVTPGDCSDGMSDRTYPFTVTVQLGAQMLNGCGWREGDDLGDPSP